MKEYIIATLAAFCFVDPHGTPSSRPHSEEAQFKNDTYQKFDNSFNFKNKKDKKVVFDTMPTNWLKVK